MLLKIICNCEPCEATMEAMFPTVGNDGHLTPKTSQIRAREWFSIQSIEGKGDSTKSERGGNDMGIRD